MDKNKLVIFDLDGTLVDSHRDLVPALNRATESEGVPPISKEDVGHVVGQGAMRMIERAYQFHDRELEVGGTIHKRLLDEFLIQYENHIADETVFYDGALESLDTLAQQGWLLAVCTNKYEHLARKLIDALGETSRFSAITGGDTFSTKKPDPEHLVQTAALVKIACERCVMVGDSINDTAAAKSAGIPVVAVDFGYSDVPVPELNANRIISHFDELAAIADEFVQ